MRIIAGNFVAISLLLWGPLSSCAQTTGEPVATSSYDALQELGQQVHALYRYKDNQFIYQQRSQQIASFSESLVGSSVDVPVEVTRVTALEVVVEVPLAGRTRCVLTHGEVPVFGNLRTVAYPGSASTLRANMLSAPAALRIDEEISSETARRLRKSDRLILRGRIGGVFVKLDTVFNPEVIAGISQWKVTEVVEAADTGEGLPE